jgi:hypothetical protein
MSADIERYSKVSFVNPLIADVLIHRLLYSFTCSSEVDDEKMAGSFPLFPFEANDDRLFKQRPV